MQINDELIEYLEGLSRLSLSDEERSEITAQLQEFMAYIDMLGELEASSVPSTRVENARAFLRADKVKPSMPADEILANAPKRQGDYFSVPKAIE